MSKKPDAEPLTLKAFLDGDLRMPIGDITLTDLDPIDNFATAAYRKAQGTLKRLMQPKWRTVIVDQLHEQKRREAIRWLGKRYVLHKVNRVQKIEVVEEVRRARR